MTLPDETRFSCPKSCSCLILCDAHLAMPDLVEALELVLDFHSAGTVAFVEKYGVGMGTKELCDRVRAALALAGGK